METREPAIAPSRPISGEQRAQALRRVNHGGARWVWDWMRSFIIAVGLFLFVRAFFVEAFKIPSGSMERTLLVGDFLLVNKLVYGAEVPFTGVHLPRVQRPKRGDVIVFVWPKDPSKNFVKRLVGLPGDTLEMHDGLLFVNGDAQGERYVTRTDPDVDPSAADFEWQSAHLVKTAEAAHMHPSRNNWGPLVVPELSYFVLGDNRDNSLDSRYWGFVPDSLVRGRPMFVYYSYAPDTSARFPWLTRIRWQRLGERVY
ncbi:MAG TPA: signal peptidase I [Gemmatimonadaceae bacterium]|nr:signal peptidase I [Gemmatimonadaceae bacterium]